MMLQTTKEDFLAMDQTEFDKAVDLDPWCALSLVHNKLTDEQFNKAIKTSPRIALDFCNDRLTWEQFKFCCNEVV